MSSQAIGRHLVAETRSWYRHSVSDDECLHGVGLKSHQRSYR
jgi:hypothetical protein